MNIEKRKVEKNLPKKGFEMRRDGDHIRFVHIYQGNETGPRTKISHSSDKIISSSLVSVMRNQLGLSNAKDLVDLVNCPLSSEDYIEILRNKGLV